MATARIWGALHCSDASTVQKNMFRCSLPDSDNRFTCGRNAALMAATHCSYGRCTSKIFLGNPLKAIGSLGRKLFPWETNNKADLGK